MRTAQNDCAGARSRTCSLPAIEGGSTRSSRSECHRCVGVEIGSALSRAVDSHWAASNVPGARADQGDEQRRNRCNARTSGSGRTARRYRLRRTSGSGRTARGYRGLPHGGARSPTHRQPQDQHHGTNEVPWHRKPWLIIALATYPNPRVACVSSNQEREHNCRYHRLIHRSLTRSRFR